MKLLKGIHIDARKLLWLDIVVAAAFFVAGALIRYLANTSYVYNDELGAGYTGYGYTAWGYLDTALVYANYLSRGNLIGVIGWSYHYGAMTPLTPLFASISILVFHNLGSLIAARLPVTLLSALTCAFMYLLGRDVLNRKCGLIAATIFAVEPVAVLSGRILYEDAIGVFFGVVAIWSWLVFQRKHGKRYLLITGVCLALSVASKELSIIFFSTILISNLRLFSLFQRFYHRGKEPSLFYTRWKYTVFTLGISLAVLVAFFPWLLPATAARLNVLQAHTVSTSGSNIFFMGELTSSVNPILYVIVLMISRINPVTVVLAILGLLVLLVRPKSLSQNQSSFAQNLLLSWVLSALFLSFIIKPFLSHYLLFFVPVMAMLTGMSISTLVISLQSLNARKLKFQRPGIFSKIDTCKGTIIAFLCILIIVSTIIYPIIVNWSSPGEYYSPAVGGIQGAARMIEIDASEYLPTIAQFVQSHYSNGSLILVFGQVPLLKYLLPGYKVMGISEFYPYYSSSPIEYFKSMGVSAIVVQYAEIQLFPNDPLVSALVKLNASLSENYDGLTLANVYSVNDLGHSSIVASMSPPFVGWSSNRGNFSSSGKIEIGDNQSYSFVGSPILSLNSSCVNTVFLNVTSYGGQINQSRIELANVSGTVFETKYFDIAPGGNIISIDNPPSPIQLRIVIVGASLSYITIDAVRFYCFSA